MNGAIPRWRARRSIATIILVVVTVWEHPWPGRADDIRLIEASVPIPFVSADGSIDREIEASAVESIADGRWLLVAHDKDIAPRIVETATGKRIGSPIVNPRFAELAKLGAKWEASAHDDDNFYYLIGAKAGDPALGTSTVAWLARFRLSKTSAVDYPWEIDDASVQRWNLAGPLASALEQEGIDKAKISGMSIEGFDITTTPSPSGPRRALAIGMRRPDDLMRAYTVDINGLESPDPMPKMRRLFAFRASGRENCPEQIRSLLRVPAWSGFLIVTSTEDQDNVFHGNTLYFLPDRAIGPNGLSEPQRVVVFEVAMKAEGMCLLPVANPNEGNRTIRLAVTFDNDPLKTRIPSRFQVLTLQRSP